MFEEQFNLAKLWYIIVTAYLRFQAHRFVRYMTKDPSPPTWKITDAFVTREHHDDFMDARSWFVPDTRWDQDVCDMVPDDWDDWKVELRCRYGEHKYRIVLRHGDTLEWPPPEPESHVHMVRAPCGLLSATLLANPGSKDVDVTARVQKYAGLKNKYHGTTVKVQDMFPFDDHEENSKRYKGLRIIDIGRSGLHIKTFSYEMNENLNSS
jgi:hypothetical protein